MSNTIDNAIRVYTIQFGGVKMKYCNQCGHSMEDESTFCPQCGAHNADATSNASRTVSRKKILAFIGLSTAVFIGIVGLLCLALPNSPLNAISESQLREDLTKTSNILSTGFITSDYVNDSDYNLTELSITSQTEKTGQQFGATYDVKEIQFSGTIENVNFKTSFTGTAYYVKNSDDWVFVNNPEFEANSTQPLKGVDFIDNNNDAKYSITDFSSTINENDGVYSSTGTQTISYEYWFATDTATNTRTFVFDNEEGWQPQDKTEVSNLKTNWKLDGKTYHLVKSKNYLFADTVNNTDASVTFVSSDDAGNITLDYSVDYAAEQGGDTTTYYDVSLSGTASGTIIHEFSSQSFSVELSNPTTGVALACSNSSSTINAGSGNVQTIDVSISTNSIYKEINTSYYNHKTNFELSGITFAENV